MLVEHSGELGERPKKPASLTRVGGSGAGEHEGRLTHHGRKAHMHAGSRGQALLDEGAGPLATRDELRWVRREEHGAARALAVLRAGAQRSEQAVSVRRGERVQRGAHDAGGGRLDADRDRAKMQVQMGGIEAVATQIHPRAHRHKRSDDIAQLTGGPASTEAVVQREQGGVLVGGLSRVLRAQRGGRDRGRKPGENSISSLLSVLGALQHQGDSGVSGG